MPSSRRRLLATVGGAAAALAGCTSVVRSPVGDTIRSAPDRRVDPGWRPGPGTWAQAGYGPANTGHNPHASPPRTEPEVRWRHSLPETLTEIVVAEGRVYCETASRLVALDVESGTRRWDRYTDANALTYVDGRLYHWGDNTDFVARGLDGTELWRTATDAESLKQYHERDGYVYLGAFSGHRILHADSGAVVRSSDTEWEFLAATADGCYTTRGGSPGTPVTYAVGDPALGERWRVETGCSVGRPAVDADRVYYPFDPRYTLDCTGPHRLRAFDTEGRPQWTATFDASIWYPAVADDRVFVSTAPESGPGRLVCLSRDGERRWRHEAAGGLKRPVVANGTVYAVPARDSDAPLVACDVATGERCWARSVTTDAPLAAVGETLYVGDGVGTDAELLALAG
jgi:hypothetical protein